MRIRKLIPIITFALFLSFFSQSFSQIKKDRKSVKYAKTIKAEELKEKLYIYASRNHMIIYNPRKLKPITPRNTIL